MEGEPRLLARMLVANDLNRLVQIDQAITGHNRRMWYERKLKRALDESDVRISLGIELDGLLVGALLGSVQYGEFGQPEPVAVLDTILVDPDFRHRGVASALVEQLELNLHGLRIEHIRTEVSWHEQELIGFLAKQKFQPAPRLVLERSVERGG